MKKIILTLLLTLSTLINVNAVAAFSLDIDGNGTINASNDGLIIFKYLLNSNANNLHTTISSNAADDRKTTAQLKAYLDNAGDILDIDGNGTTNASNDGLIVFKYLLNSNANNLHTTIASNAPGSKTTTINLKAYLDQYISTDVSNLYSGDRPTELTAEQIADANGAGTSIEHLDVLQTAEFSNYRVTTNSNEVWVADTDPLIGTIYARIDLGDNFQQLHSSLNDEEFQAIYLETIQAIWDLVNPITERQSRLNQLDALETKYNIIDSDLNEWGSQQLGPTKYVTYIYQLILGTFETYQFGEFDYIEDVTDWDTKLQELEDQIKREDRLNDFADLVGQYGVTEITPFENSAISLITVEYKQTGVANENGSPLGFSFGSYADFGAIPQAEFDTKFDEFVAKLIADEVTAAEELVAIFALGTSPTAFVDYPALDAEADGILQAERAQHIVDSLTNLNGVTVTYTINTTPKSFNVAKAGETTINVLQDSSSGSAVSLDTLSVFKDIYFQTIQAKWDILHPAVTERQSRLNQLDDLETKYNLANVTLNEWGVGQVGSEKYVTFQYQLTQGGSVESYQFGEFDFIEDVTDWDTKLQALEDQINPPGPTVESEIAALYAADTPPEALGDLITAQTVTFNDFTNLLAKFNKFGAEYSSLSNDTFTYTGIDPISHASGDAAQRKAVSLLIVTAIWHLGHPNYVAPTPFEIELAAVYDAPSPPTSLGSVVNGAALAVEFGIAGIAPRTNFIKSLAHFGVSVTSVHDSSGKPSEVNLSNGSIVPNIGTNDNMNDMSPAQFAVFTFEVVKAFWHIGNPNYVDINTVEGALIALYNADTHPTELGSVINDAAGVAYDNRSDNASDPRLAFISKLDKYGVEFDAFDDTTGNLYADFVGNTIDPIQAPVDGVNLTTANFQEWMLIIAREIWLYGHQDYIYEQREIDRIAEILAIDTVAGISINYEYPTFTISNGDKDNISQVDISYAILNAYDDTDFLAKKVEVQTAYGVQSTNLTDRTNRINTLKNNGNGYVTVTHSYDDSRGDLFNISYGGSTQHEYADTHFGGSYVRLETLDSDQYDALSTAITGKVNDLNPTVAKELATIFAADTAPVGSAPEWLPTALYAKANEQINGTARASLFRDGLLLAHGVTITQNNLDLVLSEGGWDHYINWASYSSQGWTPMTPEKYRELVFNVIKDGWRHRNETFDDERGAIINNDFDDTGFDVRITTEGHPHYDWWIYFNDVAVISGGADFENDDENYNNEYTPNIHDVNMSEAVYQRLLVFVQYMIDNQSRLKGITDMFDRSAEISNLVGSFGAQVSVTTLNDGTYHYTFSKNGNSNADPVQTNWTHAAGTTLGDLNADSWVKFYAKCRGILIGL